MAKSTAAIRIADAALTSASWVDVGVRHVIWVSLRAMGLGLVGTPQATKDTVGHIL